MVAYVVIGADSRRMVGIADRGVEVDHRVEIAAANPGVDRLRLASPSG